MDEEDQSGQGGAPFPPRSKPYPMKGLPWSYTFKRVAELLGKGGYNPVSEANGCGSACKKDPVMGVIGV